MAAPGVAPNALPTTETYLTVLPLGTTPAGRIVMVGGSHGLYRTADGGQNWYVVSDIGSGLEATSKYFSVLLSEPTSFGTTDVLVGVNGSTNGGVYLSGDKGLHWTQINQGFDPTSLNLSTLVKTSCSGCPVQYYSGTYGSGVYTRTIAVSNPPVITGWCFGSTTCPCGTDAPSGGSGQAFKICGANFMPQANIQFGWVGLQPLEGANASNCLITSSTITCAPTGSSVCGGGVGGGTPSGWGPVNVVVRNFDTRSGQMGTQYNYLYQ